MVLGTGDSRAEDVSANLDRLARMLRSAKRQGVTEGSEAVATRFRDVIVRPGGWTTGPRGGRVPSPPPRYPHIFKRTGQLQSATTAEVEEDGAKFSGRIGAPPIDGVKYPLYLEKGTEVIQARRGYQRALDHVRPLFVRNMDRLVAKAIDMAGFGPGGG